MANALVKPPKKIKKPVAKKVPNKTNGKGRKAYKVDWDVIQEYARNHATCDEIAVLTGVSISTLEAHCIKDWGTTFGSWCYNIRLQRGLKIEEAYVRLAEQGEEWAIKHYISDRRGRMTKKEREQIRLKEEELELRRQELALKQRELDESDKRIELVLTHDYCDDE